MRTWKQGRIGRISLNDKKYYYIRCLKYPLAQIYNDYNEKNGILDNLLYELNLDITVLKYTDTVVEQELVKDEKTKYCNDEKLYKLREIEELIFSNKIGEDG